MSTHLFPVLESTKQNGSPLAILLAIAAHADQNTGIAYPGNERLAELCNVKVRTVQRTIQKLADDGDITILEDGNGRGNKRIMLVNAIRKGDTHDALSYRKDDTGDALYDNGKGDIDGTKGDICDTKGDTEGVKGDIAMSPEHINNNNSIEQDLPSRSTDTDFADLCKAIEDEGFGAMTPIRAGQIDDWMKDYSSAWIKQAIGIASKRNKRSFPYVNGILNRMRAEGPDEDYGNNGTTNSQGYYTGPDTSRRDHACWHTESNKRLASTPYKNSAHVRTEEITF